jgi:hypothetical protein
MIQRLKQRIQEIEKQRQAEAQQRQAERQAEAQQRQAERQAEAQQHQSERQAEEQHRLASDALSSANCAASNLRNIYNLISAAPTYKGSTSATRSEARPVTQQYDDDVDDKHARARSLAKADAATVAESRIPTPEKGREFSDFVGMWEVPAVGDRAWLTAADNVERNLNTMLSCSINSGKTAKDWLDDLIKYRNKRASVRNKANFSPQFEVNVTHPFVFVVLNATKAPLQTLLYGAELHLYTEKGKMRNAVSYRNADAMFFSDVEKNVTFDERARRDSLLAVEAKRCLNAEGRSDALVGGERDFMIVSGDAASDMMRVGTSVFTDGVHWFFARIAWRCGDALRWEREIKISPMIDVAKTGGWKLLARWFAFAFHEAVNKPVESTGLRSRIIPWQVGAMEWQLCDVMSIGVRSVVTRWANDEHSAVVKFMFRACRERTAKNQKHFEHERQMLRKFAKESSFVHVDSLFMAFDDVYIALEDCGDALANFNIRGAAGKALAKVVVRDIWRGALPVLKAKRLCHFDITEYNVAIGGDRQSARLIDLESVTRFGENAAATPTAATVRRRPDTATAEFDEKCVCAILKCLWEHATSSFMRRKMYVDSHFGTSKSRDNLESRIERARA